MEISVKSIIRDYLYAHKILVPELANRIGLNTRNLYYVLDKDDISVSMLLRISKALNHNFFADFDPLNEKKPASTTATSAPIDVAALQNLNAMLMQENTYLKQVNQLLTDVNESLRNKQSSI